MKKDIIISEITKELSDISNLQDILIRFCKSIEQTENIDAILSLAECINEKTERLYLYVIES